ncbi:universal stress protein [Sporolactobacillus shoreicorticis]|uniref:Universal stress protein n=1 Tax=Sporolactobacillus shoreicorticis TaxID=1923877 RepID=A0ABW5S6D1_9BACL|nr:universal stress protein [Sporolactobacillus shoreicorticis]MCO7126224.1 universal stress protein [Sporolactobacillus shoreicorticis]
MYKILVPVDGSEPANRAVNEAVSIASGKKDAEITLLYVSPSPVYFPFYSMVGPSLDADVKEVEEREGNQMLDDTIKKASKGTSVTFRKKHLYGIAAQEICDYANDTKKDLIIMGNRGMGAFGQMILGSVSNKVLQLAQCPVMIVK